MTPISKPTPANPSHAAVRPICSGNAPRFHLNGNKTALFAAIQISAVTVGAGLPHSPDNTAEEMMRHSKIGRHSLRFPNDISLQSMALGQDYHKGAEIKRTVRFLSCFSCLDKWRNCKNKLSSGILLSGAIVNKRLHDKKNIGFWERTRQTKRRQCFICNRGKVNKDGGHELYNIDYD